MAERRRNSGTPKKVHIKLKTDPTQNPVLIKAPPEKPALRLDGEYTTPNSSVSALRAQPREISQQRGSAENREHSGFPENNKQSSSTLKPSGGHEATGPSEGNKGRVPQFTLKKLSSSKDGDTDVKGVGKTPASSGPEDKRERDELSLHGSKSQTKNGEKPAGTRGNDDTHSRSAVEAPTSKSSVVTNEREPDNLSLLGSKVTTELNNEMDQSAEGLENTYSSDKMDMAEKINDPSNAAVGLSDPKNHSSNKISNLVEDNKTKKVGKKTDTHASEGKNQDEMETTLIKVNDEDRHIGVSSTTSLEKVRRKTGDATGGSEKSSDGLFTNDGEKKKPQFTLKKLNSPIDDGDDATIARSVGEASHQKMMVSREMDGYGTSETSNQAEKETILTEVEATNEDRHIGTSSTKSNEKVRRETGEDTEVEAKNENGQSGTSSPKSLESVRRETHDDTEVNEMGGEKSSDDVFPKETKMVGKKMDGGVSKANNQEEKETSLTEADVKHEAINSSTPSAKLSIKVRRKTGDDTDINGAGMDGVGSESTGDNFISLASSQTFDDNVNNSHSNRPKIQGSATETSNNGHESAIGKDTNEQGELDDGNMVEADKYVGENGSDKNEENNNDEAPDKLRRGTASENLKVEELKKRVRPGQYFVIKGKSDCYSVRWAEKRKVFAYKIGSKNTSRFSATLIDTFEQLERVSLRHPSLVTEFVNPTREAKRSLLSTYLAGSIAGQSIKDNLKRDAETNTSNDSREESPEFDLWARERQSPPSLYDPWAKDHYSPEQETTAPKQPNTNQSNNYIYPFLTDYDVNHERASNR